MTKPKVTVIIPVYNVESWLEDCLNSVISQDYQELEILCVNDGSTDSSPRILERFAAHDTRIKILSHPNHGLGYTRNVGIDQAEGKYILCVDSDDMLGERFISSLVDQAETQELDLLCFDYKPFSEDDSIRNQAPQRLKHHRFEYPGIWNGRTLFSEMRKKDDYFCGGWLALYRTDWLHGHQIRFTEQILHEDEYFLFCCFLYAERAAFLPVQGYFYRLRSGSIMSGEKVLAHIKGYYRTANMMMEKCFREQDLLKNEPEFYSYALHMRHSASYHLRQNLETVEAQSPDEYEQMMLKDLSNYGSLDELNDVYNSTSWKIGQMIVNPLHGIKEKLAQLKTMLKI